MIGGGISAELNGGDFEHGMSEAAYNLAAVAAISSANNYRNSQQTAGTSTLPQAKGSDEAMMSATRGTQAAERATAGQIAGELGQGNMNIRPNSMSPSGVNWGTIGWGAAEITAGVSSIAGALAVEAATGGISTIPSALAAYTGVMSIGTGVADVMLGIYGQPTTAQLVSDTLKNDPFGRRATHLTTELLP